MATEYYVDPDVAAGGNGSAGLPWQKITNTEWTTINAALASNPVTIYFSARNAFSDTDQPSSDGISINRTDGSSNRLTFDGMSKYNTDDSSPSWSNYSGAKRFTITAGTPFNTGTTKRNYVTIRGFNMIATQFQIIRYWGGDHIIIENCDLTKTAGNTGPGLSIGYAEFTSKASPGPCVDITIRNNTIHDVWWGEALYIGGVEGQNKPGHDGVTLENNTVFSAATGGAEPDLVDIKDGVRNLVVRGNLLYNPDPNTGRDGITTLSAGVFEDNFIYNCGRNGITFGSFWNVYPNRDGAICRNNIIVNCGGSPSYGWDFGILVADAASGDQWTNLQMYGNTVYGTNGTGISINNNARVTEFSGNTIAESSSWQLSAPTASLSGTHDRNNFYRASGGNLVSSGSTYTAANITDFEANSKAVDPQHVDTTTPYTAANFQLQAASGLIDAGPTGITAWTKDHFGTARPQGASEDIGAHEYSSSTPAPVFSSAEVGLMIDTKLILTLSKTVNSPGGNYALGFTVNTSAITSAARGINQATIEFTLTTPATEGQSVTIDYDAGVGDIESQDGTPVALATFSSPETVTNNVNAAVPAFSSGDIGMIADNIAEITFTENLATDTDYETGFSFTANAVALTCTGATRQANNAKIHFTFVESVNEGESVLMSYDSVSGTIKDQHASNPFYMADITNQAITNSVVDPPTPQVKYRLRLKA